MSRPILLISFLILLSSCLKKPDYHIDISYTGEQLRNIQCPIGGIGSGNIFLNGYGGISGLDTTSMAAKDEIAPNIAYFSLYTKASEGETVVRILEREYLNDYPGPSGLPPKRLGDLPHFKEAIFHNAYPFIRIDLIDEQVPLDVTMESWSPYNPVDLQNSSLPCALIEWKLTNSTKIPTEYSIAFSLMDIKADSLLPESGQYSVSIPDKAVLSSPVYSADWRDNVQILWDDFSEDGKLNLGNDTLLFTNRSGEIGAMYHSGSLDPGESVSIPFLFSWYKLNHQTAYISDNIDLLREKTLLFSEAMITSSVPVAVLDACLSNLSSSRTRGILFPKENTHLRDGTLDVKMRSSSLSSWSEYQAMAGYQYDGTKGYMKFAPAEDVLPIRFFWSTSSAWGTIEASRAKIELICLHGELDIEELELAGKSFFVFREFDVSEPCEVLYEEEALKILFPKHLYLVEGESFLMSLP